MGERWKERPSDITFAVLVSSSADHLAFHANLIDETGEQGRCERLGKSIGGLLLGRDVLNIDSSLVQDTSLIVQLHVEVLRPFVELRVP